jgi:signal transduction histidine kinase
MDETLEAEQAQKMATFGRFAVGIVHELNNPLTTISLYADALRGRLAGSDPAAAEWARSILDATNRVTRFTKELLAYARPPAEAPEQVDLASVMEQAAHICAPVLGRVRAQLRRRFEEVPHIVGVQSSLLQVFVNLITNAAHALREEGNIVLELAPAKGPGAVARVVDDGCGMSEETLQHIFEPFFTTKPAGEGHGLGLAIVRGIVYRHGGEIAVESTPGQGAAFTVTLPARWSG